MAMVSADLDRAAMKRRSGGVVTAAAAVSRRQRGDCRVIWRRRWKQWRRAATYSVVEGDGATAVLRRRWLVSVAAATVAVTLEAVMTLVTGKESGARWG